MTREAERQPRDWRPAYMRVAEGLRDRILSGEFAPGSAIPSEPVLAREYGISRTSLRNAIRELRDWRLVESRQGAGTYVLPRVSALFDGVAVDGQPDDEKAVISALLSLDLRYVRCESSDALPELLKNGRFPVVPMSDCLRLPASDEPQRWLNALLWNADTRQMQFDVGSTKFLLSIRTDATSPTTAARAIHAVVTV